MFVYLYSSLFNKILKINTIETYSNMLINNSLIMASLVLVGICIRNSAIKLEQVNFTGKYLYTACKHCYNSKIKNWKYCIHTQNASYLMIYTRNQEFSHGYIQKNKIAGKFNMKCFGNIHIIKYNFHADGTLLKTSCSIHDLKYLKEKFKHDCRFNLKII